MILISLDGTRPANLVGDDRPRPRCRRGASATLLPVFRPHVSESRHARDGRVPDVHGIRTTTSSIPSARVPTSADPSWLLAEPLWSIAAAQGVVSASCFWVGSEGPWRSGRGPRYWLPFDDKVPEKKKVRQILAWLNGPEPRPRLITAWFHGVDGPSHRTGLDTPIVHKTLQSQDAALGILVAELDKSGAFAHTTLLIVSDHGMAPVYNRIDLAAALRTAGVKGEVYGGGGMATVSFEKDGYTQFIDKTLSVARGLGLQAWPREETPRELRARNPRFGDVVVVAPVGLAIQAGLGPKLYGAHGYLPQEASMGALLLAVGRGAPAGADLGELRSLDVAPTVLRLLGLAVPDTMEGQPIARLVPEPAVQPAPAQKGH